MLLTLGAPGLTTDEPLDVRPGRAYVAALRAHGLGVIRRPVVDAMYRDNAEHPPLGRWLLGLASALGQPFETVALGLDPLGLYVLSARVAPALAFAALVGLVAHATARRYGPRAGLASGFALAVMPRAFAHAHFAALDTFISLAWVAALLAADRALTGRRPALGMAAAGLVWGLALLTKIHGWLLVPVVLIWSARRLGRARAAPAVLAWGVVGLSLFVAGWPWLWYDPAARLSAYFGTGLVRASIRVLYFGAVYRDVDVPWHYPWFYFAATVPVGLQALGTAGAVRAWRSRRSDPFPGLLAGSILLFLGLFSTGVPVYDGERLFLPVFPLWSIFIGLGFGWAWEALGRRAGRRPARVLLVAATLSQAYGLAAVHPFGLSYYNALVGGLPGADRLGLELTYWGDAVDGVLLDRVADGPPPGAAVALVPTLYPGQGTATTTRALARRETILGDQETLGSARWVVVSRRTAYWPVGLAGRLARARPVAERRRQGVWLSRLYQMP